MKKILHLATLVFTLMSLSGTLRAQPNGTIDDINDLFQRRFIEVETPDGAKLATEVFLPITSDSLVLQFNLPFIGEVNLELIQKGVQYIVYPELDGQPNPNPFQLPLIFIRSPYEMAGMEALGWVFSVLGYGAVLQDTRGTFQSTDVYIPLYTDSWDKTPYSDFVPEAILPDGYTEGGARNPSSFTDGIYAMDFLLNDLKRNYDLDEDGQADLEDLVGNGSILYFGASALSNSGLQMALSRLTDPAAPGLKGFLNLIASELYWSTVIFENGIYKQGLVEGWVGSQINNFNENDEVNDTTFRNNIHTPADYGLSSLDEVTEMLTSMFTTQMVDGKAGVYPDGSFRKSYDARRAPVDANGEGDPTGAYSRFMNMDMPFYHISGWWDIFVTGQIQTWAQTRKHISEEHGNRARQKLIIGPWQHYFPALRNAGDLVFPPNVGDVIGATAVYDENIDFADLDLDTLLSIINVDMEKFLNSELFAFIRYAANYNNYRNVGEPLIRFPANLRYQPLGSNLFIQVPSQDFVLTHADLINWILGLGTLDGFRAKVYEKRGQDTVQVNTLSIDLPALPPLLTAVFGEVSTPLEAFPAQVDIEALPDVRFYLCGPVNDGIPGNDNVGNYWVEADTFPIMNGLQWNYLYLHADSTLSPQPPSQEEPARAYLHDPNNPVATVGGNNLDVKTPNGEKAQGPKDLARPEFINLTMEHPGVLTFETELLEDSLTLIGFPVMTLYASSLPEGASPGDPTSTDFMVRVVDVYPDGAHYQITEGIVNARARNYVKSVARFAEDDEAPFNNIAADQVYEYVFRMLPMGYTFGKGHKLKILVSSSNYPIYQVNPNVPIEDWDFFRWKPGSNETYTYNGTEYSARSAVNTIHFAPGYPSRIELPVFGREIAPCEAVSGLLASGITDSTAQLGWQTGSGAHEYWVRYRKAGTSDWTVEGPLWNLDLFLAGLDAGTVYEWQVGVACGDTLLYSESSEFESTGIPSAIDEAFTRSLRVYPNPATDRLFVDAVASGWRGTVRLVDVAGRSVRTWHRVSLAARFEADLRGVEAGAYLLEFTGSDKVRGVVPVVVK